MPGLSISELIPVLQTAIGPVILISGVGLLLLTMTNRLGRTIDRVRVMAVEASAVASEAHPDSRRHIEAQLAILWRRAHLIRLAIIMAATSALCAALLIIVLFLTALLSLEDAWLLSALFILCMTLLIGSLVVFIYDINLSLNALKLEMQVHDLGDS
jgi:hypothetical protein